MLRLPVTLSLFLPLTLPLLWPILHRITAESLQIIQLSVRSHDAKRLSSNSDVTNKCSLWVPSFSSSHFPYDNFKLISCAFLGTNITRLFFLGIPMRHFRNGMFLVTLEGILNKTVSMQLSSRECNEN